MRFFIALLLYFFCYSSALYAKETEGKKVVQYSKTTLVNFSKKHKNSLKTELFPDCIDRLHHCNQNNTSIAANLSQSTEGSTISTAKTNLEYNLTPFLFYNFIFQYLYPKHSFW